MSYAELMAMQAAGEQAGDPIADETSKAISWFFANEVPPPGADEHPAKAAKEGDEEADALLAPPGEEELEIVEPAPSGLAGGDSQPDDIPPPPGPGAEVDTEVSVEDEAESLLPKI